MAAWEAWVGVRKGNEGNERVEEKGQLGMEWEGDLNCE